MLDSITIYSFDETYIQLSSTNDGVIAELSDFFTFDVPNAKYDERVKNGYWDGKIHLYKRANGTLYKGLLNHVIKFAKDRQYDVIIEEELKESLKINSSFDPQSFISTLNIENIVPYDFQVSTIGKIIQDKRKLILSPVNSGKSLIMYCILRWYLDNVDGKILILVPSVDLILQLIQEFKDYCPHFNIDSLVHQIYQGQPKNSNKRIYLSTWQSIYEQKETYFKQFDAFIGDEAHEITAKCAKHVLESCVNAQYKVGLTGTVKDTQTHKIVLEGLTGELLEVTTSKKLIEEGRSSKILIKCLILKYSEAVRKANAKFKYPDEQKFIVTNKERNRAIALLATGIKNENVLILTQYIEHTELLAKALENSGKKIFVITGDTEKDIVIENKLSMELSNDCIIIATFGKFQRGINIKNLQNLIMATGTKSFIRLCQSIGRVLRLDGKTNTCTLWDFVDDFSYKKEQNYLLTHFFDRIKIYNNQGFPFILKNINIK
jgi:superfamily II DNA or RNA helicase